MKRLKILQITLLLTLVVGCGIIPKRVEFFQKKVQEVPVPTVAHNETVKQAAAFVAEKTKESHFVAAKENASTNLQYLTYESSIVANSLSDSLGKPLNPWKTDAEKLALKLDAFEAKLDRKFDEFKERNDELAGKKIESSGLIQISYFTYIFGLFVLVAFLWFGVKILGILYPPVQIGSTIASIPINVAQKMAAQAIKGGENFKKRIVEEIDDPQFAETVKKIFREEQEKAQDQDIQEIIKKAT